MTKEQYEKWSEPFRRHKWGIKLLNVGDKGITALVFVSYPLLLLYLILNGCFDKLFFCMIIPAISFLLVSFFRKLYFAPRPYECLDIHPLIAKETKGKSFPSRHVFSVFMIGMTFFYVSKPIGVVIGVSGILLACIRVVGGVHFPKDTAVGAMLGILFGLLYFIF